jgi:hypothetical protein
MQAIFSVKAGLSMAGNQPIDDLRLVRLGIELRQGKRAAQPIDDMRK